MGGTQAMPSSPAFTMWARVWFTERPKWLLHPGERSFSGVRLACKIRQAYQPSLLPGGDGGSFLRHGGIWVLAARSPAATAFL